MGLSVSNSTLGGGVSELHFTQLRKSQKCPWVMHDVDVTFCIIRNDKPMCLI